VLGRMLDNNVVKTPSDKPSRRPKPMRSSYPSLALAALLLVAACQTGDEAVKPARPAHGAADQVATPSDEILSRLAAADAADGATDKIIRKCITCSLLMDGDPKHTAEAHGYEAHLCSDQCLYRFTRDPDRALMSMKPPQ
jgi:hypothetical protein